MRQRERPRRLIGVVFLVAIGIARVSAAQQLDPSFRFRTLSTDHFVIYFHQGEDRLATRLAGIAESTWLKLSQPFGTTPPARTHVILVDQTELANGYATPLPRDTIAIYAVWPAGSDLLRTDDWLTLVFTHEFTHIVHLDRSEGWARVLRSVFGRLPLALPNIFLPTWQIEGIATYEESVLTGEGRLHAGDFRAIVDEAARARRLEPLDRVNGGLTDWPGGQAQYAYGLGFHAYLADHYGAGKFAPLAHESARSLPYLASRAFMRVYGKSLGTLWREYENSLLSAASATPLPPPAATRLTHHHFFVSGPRFAPPLCPTCPSDLYYSVRNADEFPALHRLRLSTTLRTDSPRQPPENALPTSYRMVTRFLGSTTGPGRETVYFDQQEIRRNAGLYSDLYSLNRQTGSVRRLTTGARIIDPDLAPDERTIVAVRNHPGQRDLVLIRLGQANGTPEIATLLAEPDTQFNAPRWSPDGRFVAVERHRLGGRSEIVLVDVSTRMSRVVASHPDMRWVTPTWRRDGQAIVAAADVGEGPFNLYEIDLARAGSRQLTHTTGGATWPDVSPDGRTIVYVGYTAEGFDLFQTPYPKADTQVIRSQTSVAPLAASAPGASATLGSSAVHEYRSWATFWPTSWSPVVEGSSEQLRIGAATSAADVLGYHVAAASATWGVRGPSGASADGAGNLDWAVTYAYARWRPLFFASASRETSFFTGPPTDEGLASTATLHEQKTEAGILFRVSHVRVAHTVTASFVRSVDNLTLPDDDRSLNRSSARAAWSLESAQSYGNSISSERGIAVGATTTLVRRAFGASGRATTTTGDWRVYIPGLAAHHVVAIRIAGGASTGERNVRRTFLLGGGVSNLGLTDFGSSGISLLRGFPENTFAGTHVALFNADYRLPLARPERGIGTWPLFLHTVHAAVTADAGHAWTRGFTTRDLKSSIGAELSCDLVIGYNVRLTATVGAARGYDGSHVVPNSTTIYARIDRAF